MALIESKHYKEETIHTWNEMIGIECEKKHGSNFEEEGKEIEWIFKGHKEKDWRLRTTLEREIGNIGINTKELHSRAKNREEYEENFDVKLNEIFRNGLYGQFIYDIESGLIRKFQRQYYHYDLRSPERNNIIEWLALMRHYGAPVRLLDWTYSFFVAVFFAIEEAEGDCAVWALEKRSIIDNVLGGGEKSSILPKHKRDCLIKDKDVVQLSTWKRVFLSPKSIPFAFPLNPFRLNERLVIQQGDFLCPGDISKPFEENLAAVLPSETNQEHYKLYKYVIKYDVKERKEILLNLHRMNINRATLFPGLEGFAQSLRTLLVSPKNLLSP